MDAIRARGLEFHPLRLLVQSELPIQLPGRPTTTAGAFNRWADQVVRALAQLRDRKPPISRRTGTSGGGYVHPFRINAPPNANASVSYGVVYTPELYEDTDGAFVPCYECAGQYSNSSATLSNSTSYGVWLPYVQCGTSTEAGVSVHEDYTGDFVVKLVPGTVHFDSSHTSRGSLQTKVAADSLTGAIWIGVVVVGADGTTTVTQDLRSDAWLPYWNWPDLAIVGNNAATVTLADGTWEIDVDDSTFRDAGTQ